MTDLQAWVAPTYDGLADLLASSPADTWDAPSLCASWHVRHVVAHVTMPARLTTEQFAAELAAAGNDFDALSNAVATRDAALPVSDHLTHLRSPTLHRWQPPGGGAAGALSHAVIHSIDVTLALGRPAVAPADAVVAVLDQLVIANGAWFGLDLTGVRLEAADADWRWGSGAGPGVFICNECIDLCGQIAAAELGRKDGHGTGARRTTSHDELPMLKVWDGLSDDELLAEMVKAHGAHENVDRAVAQHVAALRARGVSWARIGQALGMTRQSAWERFSGEE